MGSHRICRLALIGRTNVGKSALFNALTGTQNALVSRGTRTTRGHQYGKFRWKHRTFVVVDTHGIHGFGGREWIRWSSPVRQSHVVLFVVDGKQPCSPYDRDAVGRLRRLGRPIVLVVNKIDDESHAARSLDFYSFACRDVVSVSALHGTGVAGVLDCARRWCRCAPARPSDARDAFFDRWALGHAEASACVRVGIVGRPNVGKSTLTNRMVRFPRMEVDRTPGTTTNAVGTPVVRRGMRYAVFDTAGMRRMSRAVCSTERDSIEQSRRILRTSDVVVLLLDASIEVCRQDLSMLQSLEQRRRVFVVALNKWDTVSARRRVGVRRAVERRLKFLPFVDLHCVSARYGTGTARLFRAVARAHFDATRKISTAELNRAVQSAVRRRPPPSSAHRGVRFKYAHFSRRRSWTVVLHGRRVSSASTAYRRYLRNRLLRSLGLSNVSVALEFRES